MMLESPSSQGPWCCGRKQAAHVEGMPHVPMTRVAARFWALVVNSSLNMVAKALSFRKFVVNFLEELDLLGQSLLRWRVLPHV